MRSWWVTAALAVIALGVQVYGLYRVGAPTSPPWFPLADKVQHLFGFGVPVLLVLLTLVLRQRAYGSAVLRGRRVGLVVAAFGLHAVISELIQGRFYRSRTGDPLDVLADTTGIQLGWLGYRLAARALDRPAVRV